jgi:hypothetical protein
MSYSDAANALPYIIFVQYNFVSLLCEWLFYQCTEMRTQFFTDFSPGCDTYFMHQLDWAKGCPDSWKKLFLGVCMDVSGID